MIFGTAIDFLADLQVLLVPLARAGPDLIVTPESSGSDAVFFDSEPTYVGHKQRCRDMSSLSQCLCGEGMRPGDESAI